MTRPDGDPLWYRDAVIYQLHVKAFFDSNGDGIGDIAGLSSKLDYIRDLGVNTIWVMPFYPSPLRDDGYDVADYHNVHPQYGTRNDLRVFIREAHRRGLRVVTELVINHTSDQHRWFQAARRAPRGSSKRNFYVWSDDPNRYAGTRIIFNDAESSNWTWDPLAQAWYWHRFFSHQPDLNFDNPSVLRAVMRIMRFWADMGVDGFRLDAIPFLCEREGTNNENLPETHAVIKRIRAMLDEHHPHCMLLAEANQWPEDVRGYFGDGDECHMAYHFPLMPRMYMAIAQEDRHPIVEIMQQTPEIPANCQWAIFLRSHDELLLDMVTDRERDYMYKTYAIDPRARINLGIRRRLAPLMENDRNRIELMNSLLLSMPGSPIIYYGDEIGMGDNIFLGDRDGVRTPMQWSPDRNAGFSRADPQSLYLPPIMDALYGYEAVNVEAQMREPASLLNWMRRMLAVRRTSRAFGRGTLEFLTPGNRKVLAYLREYAADETGAMAAAGRADAEAHPGEAADASTRGEADAGGGESRAHEVILCAANLSRSAQPVELDLSRFRGFVPVEMLGRTAFPPIGDLPYLLTLPAWGFYWFRLSREVETPVWYEEHVVADDLPVLVLFDGWASLFRERVAPWRSRMAARARESFEHRILPRFLAQQRWYIAQDGKRVPAMLADAVIIEAGEHGWLLALVRNQTEPAEQPDHVRPEDSANLPAAPAEARVPPTYFLPMSLVWGDIDDAQVRALGGAAVLTKVRQRAQVGVIADAVVDEAFCHALVHSIGRGDRLAATHGEIRFQPCASFAAIAGTDIDALALARGAVPSSNAVAFLGERLFLKVYRRLHAGVDPEVEVGRHLTDVLHFAHSAPVAGWIEHVDADGVPTTLAILQQYVPNQGDAWMWAVDYLERFLESGRLPGGAPEGVHNAFLDRIATLGTRVGELHCALATPTGDPAFDPVVATEAEVRQWVERVREDAVRSLVLLEQHLHGLPDHVTALAAEILARREDIVASVRTPAVLDGFVRMRLHGDLHLGQVLLSDHDFFLIDFEGDRSRPVARRRRSHSPLRDVAGMMRSFDYARQAALRDMLQGPEDPQAALDCAAEWLVQTRAAFLSGYERAVADARLFPAPDAAHELLRVLEFEKALYELRFELTNRLPWTGIPMRAIIQA